MKKLIRIWEEDIKDLSIIEVSIGVITVPIGFCYYFWKWFLYYFWKDFMNKLK